MALSSGDTTYDFLQVLLSNLLWKDELFQIGLFKSNENVQKHLFHVSQKLAELNVPVEKQDILYELASVSDFEAKKDDIKWLKQKLEELFGKKQSKVSSYSSVLKIKQLPGQSTRSYLSNVRIHCQKHFTNPPPAERESCLILAFTNGLLNQSTRKILEELKPKTPDEAYSLIKDEKIDDETPNASLFALKESHDQCSCLSKIEHLTAKIGELELKISKLLKPARLENQTGRTPSNYRCFNCNMPGHIARYCKKRPTCKNCGGVGHIAENCRRWSKPVAQKLRRMTNESESGVSEPPTEIIDTQAEEFQEYEEHCMENNHPPTMYAMKSGKKEIKYPKKINAWAQYIEGQGN